MAIIPDAVFGIFGTVIVLALLAMTIRILDNLQKIERSTLYRQAQGAFEHALFYLGVSAIIGAIGSFAPLYWPSNPYALELIGPATVMVGLLYAMWQFVRATTPPNTRSA